MRSEAPKVLKALKTAHYVDVARQTARLKLSVSVEVPLSKVRDHLGDLYFDVEISSVMPLGEKADDQR